MNNITPLPAVQPPMERRAAALADIQQMHEDLNEAHEHIGQLKADLNRETDRCTLLVEERNRYRHDALVYRDKLVELATSMSNIGLMTVAAQEIMRVAQELTAKDAPTDTAGSK